MPLPADPAAQIDRAERLSTLVDGFPERVPGALPALRELLDEAANAEVRAAAVRAVGDTWTDDGIQLLLGRGLEDDDVRVRRELATALGSVDPEGELVGQVAEVLRALSADIDDDVRDRACASLAASQDASPETVAAFRGRLDDAHDDTRCGALLGLAQLGDRAALPLLRDRLETADPFEIFRLELQAAEKYADPSLLPGLRRIETAWRAEETDNTGTAGAGETGSVSDDGVPDETADDAEAADDNAADADADMWADLNRAIAASANGRAAGDAGPSRVT
ncbi:HEAT repeat domain-containing protein [Nakamurella aerolata]|uniref:HEAT repeat protein n=1 Tax=Nakamurella aerolata TaxID=1656892 RepID=A0A849A654_9ACTN|nr:HEAT repeat domain-containing protein [Nakamurella aerolata]NNG34501.1 hypothetical protein [Nakamurella aerolata]